ncbi:hypothetical protein PGAL8A_00233500 [Plasmodium gallinaceum]|uniref:AP2/ERF domain-containing protein n=1 Tax=Plasmodium gallinaceum TaxID=5849 RepID=A0A1J1GR82_PLAGA|nr:hypothetical protein PGAL8A_00233500 [Plasmodium gallinaceum]CRG94937.1 hypothetical protein PGAL8A_00233500 [Plasmodium gallinaceum]
MNIEEKKIKFLYFLKYLYEYKKDINRNFNINPIDFHCAQILNFESDDDFYFYNLIFNQFSTLDCLENLNYGEIKDIIEYLNNLQISYIKSQVIFNICISEYLISFYIKEDTYNRINGCNGINELIILKKYLKNILKNFGFNNVFDDLDIQNNIINENKKEENKCKFKENFDKEPYTDILNKLKLFINLTDKEYSSKNETIIKKNNSLKGTDMQNYFYNYRLSLHSNNSNDAYINNDTKESKNDLEIEKLEEKNIRQKKGKISRLCSITNDQTSEHLLDLDSLKNQRENSMKNKIYKINKNYIHEYAFNENCNKCKNYLNEKKNLDFASSNNLNSKLQNFIKYSINNNFNNKLNEKSEEYNLRNEEDCEINYNFDKNIKKNKIETIETNNNNNNNNNLMDIKKMINESDCEDKEKNEYIIKEDDRINNLLFQNICNENRTNINYENIYANFPYINYSNPSLKNMLNNKNDYLLSNIDNNSNNSYNNIEKNSSKTNNIKSSKTTHDNSEEQKNISNISIENLKETCTQKCMNTINKNNKNNIFQKFNIILNNIFQLFFYKYILCEQSCTKSLPKNIQNIYFIFLNQIKNNNNNILSSLSKICNICFPFKSNFILLLNEYIKNSLEKYKISYNKFLLKNELKVSTSNTYNENILNKKKLKRKEVNEEEYNEDEEKKKKKKKILLYIDGSTNKKKNSNNNNNFNNKEIISKDNKTDEMDYTNKNNNDNIKIICLNYFDNNKLLENNDTLNDKKIKNSLCDISPCHYNFMDSQNENKSCDNELKIGMNNFTSCSNNNNMNIEKSMDKISNTNKINLNNLKIDEMLNDENEMLFNYIKNNSLNNNNNEELLFKHVVNYLYGNVNTNNFNNNYVGTCDNNLDKYRNCINSNNCTNNKCNFNNNQGAYILAKIIKKYLTDIEDPLNNYENKVIDYFGNNLNSQILNDKTNSHNCCTNSKCLNKNNHSKIEKNASVNSENPPLHNASFLNYSDNVINEKCFCKCKCHFKNNNTAKLKEKNEMNYCSSKNNNTSCFGRFNEVSLKNLNMNNYNCNEKILAGNFPRENSENKFNNKVCIKNKIHSYLNYNYLCNLEKKKKDTKTNFDNIQEIETNMNNENSFNNMHAYENDKNNSDSFTNISKTKKLYPHGKYIALNDHIKIKYDTDSKINCSHINLTNSMKTYEYIKMKNINGDNLKSNYIIDLNDYKESIICVKNVTSININKSSILLFGSNIISCEDNQDNNNNNNNKKYIVGKEISCFINEENKTFNNANICNIKNTLSTCKNDSKKKQVEKTLLHNVSDDNSKEQNALNSIYNNLKIRNALNVLDDNNLKISNKLNDGSIEKPESIKIKNTTYSNNDEANPNFSSNYLRNIISLKNNPHNIESDTLKNILSSIKIKSEKDDDVNNVSMNLSNSSDSFKEKKEKLNKCVKKRIRIDEENENYKNEINNKKICKHFTVETKKNNYNSIYNEEIKNNLMDDIIRKIISVCYAKNNINKINNFNDKDYINCISNAYRCNSEANDSHMNNHNSNNIETNNNAIDKETNNCCINSCKNNCGTNSSYLNNNEIDNFINNNETCINETNNSYINDNNKNINETNDSYKSCKNNNMNDVSNSYINNDCKNSNETNNSDINYNCANNNIAKNNEINHNFTNNNIIYYSKDSDNYKCTSTTENECMKNLEEKIKNEKISKCINNALNNYMKKITNKNISLENKINDNILINPYNNSKKKNKSYRKIIDLNYDKNKRKYNKQKYNLNYNTLLTQFDFLEYSNNEKSFFLNNNSEEDIINQNINEKMKNKKNICNNELEECLHSLNNKMKECLQERCVKNKVKSEEYTIRKENNIEKCNGFIEYNNNINNGNIIAKNNETQINEGIDNKNHDYFNEKDITENNNIDIKLNNNSNVNINIKKENNPDSICKLAANEQVINKETLHDFSKNNTNEMNKNKEEIIHSKYDLLKKGLENNNTVNNDIEDHSYSNSRTSKSFDSIEDYINDLDNSKKKTVDTNQLENYKIKTDDEKKKRRNKKDYGNSILMKHDPPIPGVSFDRIKNRWVAGLRTENGRYIRKYFSVLRFGMEEAKYKAIECRINYGSSKCKRKGKMNADIKNALIYCQNIDRSRLINILDEDCGKSLFL